MQQYKKSKKFPVGALGGEEGTQSTRYNNNPNPYPSQDFNEEDNQEYSDQGGADYNDIEGQGDYREDNDYYHDDEQESDVLEAMPPLKPWNGDD